MVNLLLKTFYDMVTNGIKCIRTKIQNILKKKLYDFTKTLYLNDKTNDLHSEDSMLGSIL